MSWILCSAVCTSYRCLDNIKLFVFGYMLEIFVDIFSHYRFDVCATHGLCLVEAADVWYTQGSTIRLNC